MSWTSYNHIGGVGCVMIHDERDDDVFPGKSEDEILEIIGQEMWEACAKVADKYAALAEKGLQVMVI